MQLHASANGAVLKKTRALMFSYRTGVRSMEMTDEMREYLFNLM
jgi:hypothetical protein